MYTKLLAEVLPIHYWGMNGFICLFITIVIVHCQSIRKHVHTYFGVHSMYNARWFIQVPLQQS